jgi:hypothetical protein
VYQRDLLRTLEEQEVHRVGQELAIQHKMSFKAVHDGERLGGIFKERG